MSSLSLDEKLAALDYSGLAQGMSRQDQEALAALCGTIELEADEILLDEGTESEQLYVIVSGSIEVRFFLAAEESFQEICRLRQGAVVGEMAMLEDDVHSARTVALEKTTVLVFSNRELQIYLQQHPSIGYQFMFNLGRLLSRRLRFTNLAIRHQLTK